MQIVAALWIDNVEFRREYEGAPTKIDVTGAYFSVAAHEYPAHLTPHLLVLLRAESDHARMGTLDVAFVPESAGGEPAKDEVGHHRAPVTIQPPGKFFYQLVRPELTFAEAGTIEAHCTITETGSTVVTPLTVVD